MPTLGRRMLYKQTLVESAAMKGNWKQLSIRRLDKWHGQDGAGRNAKVGLLQHNLIPKKE